jgi:hypothetical protein
MALFIIFHSIPPLTKTNFLAYLECPEGRWLEKSLAEYP